MTTRRRSASEVEAELARRRGEMVDRDIEARGVGDGRVLAALRRVRRDRFVPDELAEHAYDDRSLPIELDQTISQPYIVAVMVAAAEIEPDDRVLEIGTGSGYGAAVLGCLSNAVTTVERLPELATAARRRLAEEGFDQVTVVDADGTLGWPAGAPYDVIIVTAVAPEVPGPLTDQLADGGRLVIPVGPLGDPQQLLLVQRRGDRLTTRDLGAVRFVPLVGACGWPRRKARDAPD